MTQKNATRAIPIDQSGFLERFRETVIRGGEKKMQAEIAETTSTVLNRWLKGESRPPLYGVAAIAYNSNTSMDWLLTGVGSKYWILPDEAADLDQALDQYDGTPRTAVSEDFTFNEDVQPMDRTILASILRGLFSFQQASNPTALSNVVLKLHDRVMQIKAEKGKENLSDVEIMEHVLKSIPEIQSYVQQEMDGQQI